MIEVHKNSTRSRKGSSFAICALILMFVPVTALAAKHKKQAATPAPAKAPNPLDVLDYSKIVWPNPPAIARVKFSRQFFGEKRETKQQQKQKQGWMDKLA